MPIAALSRWRSNVTCCRSSWSVRRQRRLARVRGVVIAWGDGGSVSPLLSAGRQPPAPFLQPPACLHPVPHPSGVPGPAGGDFSEALRLLRQEREAAEINLQLAEREVARLRTEVGRCRRRHCHCCCRTCVACLKCTLQVLLALCVNWYPETTSVHP